MIQIKHVAPTRCKILRFLGFTSISRMFATCTLGVRPCNKCEGCENNFGEIFIENFERGMSDGLKQRKEFYKKMNKVEVHKQICETLNKTYEAKNADYGDSFSKLRQEFPNAILIRITDKLERLKTLYGGGKCAVDESIEDTLLDLANYAIMEVIERFIDECDCCNCGRSDLECHEQCKEVVK